MSAPLWTPSAERVERAQLTAFRRRIELQTGRAAARPTPICGAGRSRSARRSGARPGTACEVIGEPGEAPYLRGRPHARRALLPRGAAELRREPAAPRRRGARADLRERERRAPRALVRRAARPGRRARGVAARRGRARGRPGRRHPAELPRGDRRHAGRDARSARCGRRARPTSACAACSTASARSSRRCCSPPTATGTAARRTRSPSASRRSAPACRRSSTWWRSASSAGAPLARARDFAALAAVARTRAALRAPALRAPALHPVLVGHDRRPEGHRALRRRRADEDRRRAPPSHRSVSRATGSSTSRPAAG